MSKKVKCMECECSMHWSLPERVLSGNIDYAKHCLIVARRSIVCGETMKTKRVGHEQYCKKFKPKVELDFKMDEIYQTEIANLDEMIQTYESHQN